LGTIIGSYKSGVTRIARRHGLIDQTIALWQSRYHDHIIRNDATLNNIRAYVAHNPALWESDTFYIP
jgi:putative transposase